MVLAGIGPVGPAQAASPIRGIDVSHWQGEIAWDLVAAARYKFAFAKATENRTYADPTYTRNRSKAIAAGLKFGAYHFARPTGSTLAQVRADARLEAEHFLEIARPAPGNLVPVLDLEDRGGLGVRKLKAWAWSFVRTVESAIGMKPLIYSGYYFWRDYLGDTQAFAQAGYRLWLPQYRDEPPVVPAGNWGGRGWTLWQFTSTGRVSGISGDVDTNYFSGSWLSSLTIKSKPVNQEPPVVSETAEVGQTVTATTGTWTGTKPLRFSYEWQRCDSGGCVPIEGATAAHRVVEPDDAGAMIRVAVTANNAVGEAVAFSAPVGPVGAVDRDPPSTPIVDVAGRAVQRRPRFEVTWSATDAFSGVDGYDVRYRRAGADGAFAARRRVATRTTGMRALMDGAPGNSYCFSARAHDLAGNTSSWSHETCTTLPFDDRVLAGRGWERAAGRGRYLGTYSVTTRRGRSLALSGTARAIALVVERCPSCGAVEVRWNGSVLAQFDLRALQRRRVVRVARFDEAQTGILRIVVTSRGKRVAIDGAAFQQV